MRGGAGRRGRCYGMYLIDSRLSRVAQRSVLRAFAGVMWVCVWALRHRNIGLHYYDARCARGAPWAKRATRVARGGERVGRKRLSARAALEVSL